LNRIETLLKGACEKYDSAVKLNPKYSTACNSWALALSTHAKITENESLAEDLFACAYEKFQQAITSRPDNSIEVCNWAMTVVSHAVTREKMMKRKNYMDEQRIKPLFKKAKEILNPLVKNNDHWSFFCMARMYAASRKELKCKHWLDLCKMEWEAFLKKATRWQLAYFENVKQCSWYQEFVTCGKQFEGFP